MPTDKAMCDNRKRCSWVGTWDQVLEAKHPFLPDEVISGCPECKEIDMIRNACDEPKCRLEATCGTPTDSGYRRTCSKHKQKKEKTQ